MKTAKAFVLGVLVIAFILFIVQNLNALTHAAPLKLDLVFTSFQTPPLMMALLLSVCFLLGYTVAYSLGLVERRRLKRTIRGLQQHQARIEAELVSLRNLPITGEPTSPTALAGNLAVK